MLGIDKNNRCVNYGDWLKNAEGRLWEVDHSNGAFVVLHEIRLSHTEITIHKSLLRELELLL